MKARVKIELPPGAILTDASRAALVSAVAHELGCCGDELEKAEKAPRQLPHRAPQAWVDETGKLYERIVEKMLEDIAAELAKP